MIDLQSLVFFVRDVGLDRLVRLPSALDGMLIILYMGPETALPLLSALAAVVGFLLMVWHRAVALARKVWRFFARNRPHIGQ
jgi:hypothetical protein